MWPKRKNFLPPDVCCIASPAGRNVRWTSVVITCVAPAGRASNKFKENTLPCLSQTGEGFSLNLKLDEMDAHAVSVVCVHGSLSSGCMRATAQRWICAGLRVGVRPNKFKATIYPSLSQTGANSALNLKFDRICCTSML